MSAITAKASRKMKKYAVLTREPRCFLGSFDFSWEQRKAIDIADYSKGNGYSKGDLTDAGTPIILYGRLYTKYQFAISEVDTFAVPRNGAVYSQGNEVIVPASGETAEDIARASAVEKSGVLLGGDLNILRPFEFMNPLFLALAISNGEPQKELAKKAQGKSVVHIHNSDIQEVTIAYPSRTEQDQIVSVFRQLDNLITLHQRKYADLCSPSQVVFSLLFATSTFSWEQRRFFELYERVSRKNDLTYGRNDIISVANMYFKPDSYITDDSYLLTYNIFELGDIAFEGNKSKNYAHGRFVENTIGNGIVSHVFDVFKPIMNPYDLLFWKYAINNERLMGSVLLRSTKASTMMTNLVATDFLQESFLVPTYPEQQKIGAFFQQLDHLITLHQRECISFIGKSVGLIQAINKKQITSSWEQRKFEEIAVRSSVICSDANLPRVEYEDIVSGTGRLNKDIYAKESSKSGIAFHQGDVLYGKLRPYVQNWLLPAFDGLAVGDFWVLQPQNADSSFLYRLIQSRQFDEVANQSTGTKMPRADWKLVSKTMFSIPSNICEQAAIGTYFTALDYLITLHQRKPFLMKWRTSDANRNQTNRLVL